MPRLSWKFLHVALLLAAPFAEAFFPRYPVSTFDYSRTFRKVLSDDTSQIPPPASSIAPSSSPSEVDLPSSLTELSFDSPPASLLSSSSDFVTMFRGSSQYIARHRGATMVLHIPGDILNCEHCTLDEICADIALLWLLGVRVVVTIGCRPQVEERLQRREEFGVQVESEIVNGVRVTDEDVLRVVKESAGFVRFEVERNIAKAMKTHESDGGNVVGGNFYSAMPMGVIQGTDYKFTGLPRRIHTSQIEAALAAQDICVLTSMGVSPSGEMFNVATENLAASVASALKADKIVYYLTKPTCVYNKGILQQHLRLSDAKALLDRYNMTQTTTSICAPTDPEILSKVSHSLTALSAGVRRAHIISPNPGSLLTELYTRDGSGTLISRDLYDGIRRAIPSDVPAITDLISPLVSAGNVKPRKSGAIEKDILTYYVYTRDEVVIAVGQMRRYDGDLAEIGCLVVADEYRRGGRGDAMLCYLERLCYQSGARRVVVLSTVAMEFFVERGWRECNLEVLPDERIKEWGSEGRNSRILMKEIKGERDVDEDELMWDR